MARPLRLVSPGDFYHVTVRGDRKEPIFESDGDRSACFSSSTRPPTCTTGTCLPTA
jgi:hypothetical protein